MDDLTHALQGLQRETSHIDPVLFSVTICVSLAASLVAMGLYIVFYENRGTGSQVYRAFPLLGISVTTLFIAIQMSLPLSLGLLGALSIIRFRTPIKEPEEVGFIMLVITSSIACATFNFHFLVVLYAVALAALLLLRWAAVKKRMQHDGVLVLAMKDEEVETHLAEIMGFVKANTHRCKIDSSASRGGLTSIQIDFALLKLEPPVFIAQARQRASLESINVYLNRPGGLPWA